MGKALLRSPLKWYGGKWHLVSKFVDWIPEHKTYVEVFSGSAALLFAKKQADLDVINDLDDGVTNFFQVLRDPMKAKELHRRLQLTPYTEADFLEARATWRDCADDVERVRRWFVSIRLAYGGLQRSGFGFSRNEGRKGMPSSVSGFVSAVDRIPDVAERLRRVQVMRRDFREIIEMFDMPETFFYLDPPYIHDTRKSKSDYAHEMTDVDHEELVEKLLGMRGKAMLSGYATPIYGPLECAGWVRKDISWKTCMTKRNMDRTETVWIKNW